MEGVIVTIQKEELEEIISRAVAEALQKLEDNREQDTPDSGIMQTEDLCKYLKIKRSAVYQLTTYKRIPYLKRGKRIFFKKEEIDEWLRNGRQATVFRENEENRLTSVGKSRK